MIAHWRTPIGAPRRYDTWFFAARAPAGQDGRHDDVEADHGEWVRPDDVLRRGEGGGVDLIYPTLRSLEVLARFPTASAFLEAVAVAEASEPRVLADGIGERVVLPGEPEAAPVRSSWTIPLPDLGLDEAAGRRGAELREGVVP